MASFHALSGSSTCFPCCQNETARIPERTGIILRRIQICKLRYHLSPVLPGFAMCVLVVIRIQAPFAASSSARSYIVLVFPPAPTMEMTRGRVLQSANPSAARMLSVSSKICFSDPSVLLSPKRQFVSAPSLFFPSSCYNFSNEIIIPCSLSLPDRTYDRFSFLWSFPASDRVL